MATEDITVRIRANMGDFNRVMGQSMESFRFMNKNVMPQTMSLGGRLANRFRMMTHGLRGFRMEMLSVMFFGMGMKRFFTGLLRPALELTGVFDLFRTILQILFLPIALQILDWVILFFDWVGGLSEETKLAIGKFALLGAALGVLLFLFGSITLGIGGIILAFGGMFLIIDKLIPDITVLGVNMSSFIEAGLGLTIVTSLWKGLKAVSGGFLDRLKELPFVQKTLEAFKEPLEIIKGLFGKNKAIAKEWLDELKKKIEDLNLPEFIDSWKDLGAELTAMIPDFKEIVTLMARVARFINRVIDGGKRAIQNDRELLFGPSGGGSSSVHELNFNPIVTINASSNVDVGTITRQLGDDFLNEANRLSRS